MRGCLLSCLSSKKCFTNGQKRKQFGFSKQGWSGQYTLSLDGHVHPSVKVADFQVPIIRSLKKDRCFTHSISDSSYVLVIIVSTAGTSQL